jgi:hypothetical protein
MRDLGNLYKLDIAMNTVNRKTRRKTCCWHSRLESEQMSLLKEQVNGQKRTSLIFDSQLKGAN